MASTKSRPWTPRSPASSMRSASAMCPRDLERIAIVEVDPGRAARLRERLDEVLRPHDLIAGDRVGDALDDGRAEHLDRVGYDSAGRDHAFVAMPFADEFEDLFHLESRRRYGEPDCYASGSTRLLSPATLSLDFASKSKRLGSSSPI